MGLEVILKEHNMIQKGWLLYEVRTDLFKRQLSMLVPKSHVEGCQKHYLLCVVKTRSPQNNWQPLLKVFWKRFSLFILVGAVLHHPVLTQELSLQYIRVPL